MSKNIEIQINQGSNTYETLIPKASYSNMADTLNIGNTIGNLPYTRVSNRLVAITGSRTGDGNLSGFTINFTPAINLCYFITSEDEAISMWNSTRAMDTNFTTYQRAWPWDVPGFGGFITKPSYTSNVWLDNILEYSSSTKYAYTVNMKWTTTSVTYSFSGISSTVYEYGNCNHSGIKYFWLAIGTLV